MKQDKIRKRILDANPWMTYAEIEIEMRKRTRRTTIADRTGTYDPTA